MEVWDIFIGYGQSWCGSMTTESEKDRVSWDDHALDRDRVNYIVKYMPDFTNAFHCNVGVNKLSIQKKDMCAVW